MADPPRGRVGRRRASDHRGHELHAGGPGGSSDDGLRPWSPRAGDRASPAAPMGSEGTGHGREEELLAPGGEAVVVGVTQGDRNGQSRGLSGRDLQRSPSMAATVSDHTRPRRAAPDGGPHSGGRRPDTGHGQPAGAPGRPRGGPSRPRGADRHRGWRRTTAWSTGSRVWTPSDPVALGTTRRRSSSAAGTRDQVWAPRPRWTSTGTGRPGADSGGRWWWSS